MKLKGILLTFFIVLFIIIATYSAIVVINNSIADKIEKNLTEFNLPESDIYRNLVVIKKVKETPKKYPRKAGLPTKEPIA